MAARITPRSSSHAQANRRVRTALMRGAVLALLLLSAGLWSGANAQQPSPSPTPTSGSASFSSSLTRMSIEAARVLPLWMSEVENPLIGWFITLAQILGAALVMTAFLKLVRQHQGGSFDIGWWFSRVAICVALISSTTVLVNFLAIIGGAVAYGSDTRSSLLNEYRVATQQNFNESYAKFQAGLFTVRVNGRELPVNPNPDPSDPGYGIIGVLYNREATLETVTRQLDINSWSMTSLFSLLSGCRTVLELGDFLLLLVRSFLLLAVRLAAPFMVALAIDREYAKQSSYKFAWGVAILTLAFPTVAQIARILAYGAGGIALALGDNDPLFRWDPTTLTAIADPTAQPAAIIVIMALVMFFAGIFLIFTPIITYKIVMGQVYEVVANVASGVAGGMISTGVGLVSTQAAAAVNRQAEMTQVHGQADATREQVTGRRDAANISARGNEVAATAAARGAQVAQLSSIEGARQAGVISAAAAGRLGRETTAASVAAQGRETVIQRDQANTMHTATERSQQTHAAGEASAARRDAWINHGFGAIPVLGAPVGEGVISGFGTSPQTVRHRAAGEAATTFMGTAIGAQNSAADSTVASQQQYGQDVSAAYTRQEGANIHAANTQAGIASGGVVRGTNITVGGIQQKYQYDVQANEREYQGGMRAMEISRTAGEEAAHLRHAAQLISSFGSIAAAQTNQLFRELRH